MGRNYTNTENYDIWWLLCYINIQEKETLNNFSGNKKMRLARFIPKHKAPELLLRLRAGKGSNLSEKPFLKDKIDYGGNSPFTL